MYACKENQESQRLIAFYIVYTCIYFPILLGSLIWTEGIYDVGKYSFQSVLIIIVVAEMTKFTASSLHYKLHDINLSKRQDERKLVNAIKNLFAKQKWREVLKTLLTMCFTTVVFFIIAILYGAEVSSKHEATLMFSSLLTVLTIFPACVNLGSAAVLTALQGATKPTNHLESLMHQNLYLTLCGAWLGAFVIPLDWDRAWQVWPIPCSTGAMLGFIASHALMMFRIRIPFNYKTKIK